MVTASSLTPEFIPPPRPTRDLDTLVSLACRVVGARSAALLLSDAPDEPPRVVATCGQRRAQGDTERTRRARVPVPLHDGRVGMLIVADPVSGQPFDEATLEALHDFAALIADHVAAGLRRQSLVQAREDERRRIAWELHDETGHLLTTAIWRMEHALRTLPPEASAAREAVERAHHALVTCATVTRDVVSELPPRLLQARELAGAVRFVVDRFREGTDIQVGLSLPHWLPDAGSPVALATFRVVQEALTNIRKHARAGRVWVRLALYPDTLTIVVEDDGVGYRGTEGTVSQGKLGVVGMRERVESLGGTFALGAREGGGTRLTASLPLQPPN